MARRYKKKARRSRKMSLPMAVLAPVAVEIIYNAKLAMSGESGQLQALANVTGIDNGKVSASRLVGTYGPILGGVIVHKAASRFGVNRAIANAGVPLFRI